MNTLFGSHGNRNARDGVIRAVNHFQCFKIRAQVHPYPAIVELMRQWVNQRDCDIFISGTGKAINGSISFKCEKSKKSRPCCSAWCNCRRGLVFCQRVIQIYWNTRCRRNSSDIEGLIYMETHIVRHQRTSGTIQWMSIREKLIRIRIHLLKCTSKVLLLIFIIAS